MITERQLRRVIDRAGYKVLSLMHGTHYKLRIADDKGKIAKLVVSTSPRSQAHWPHFVLADIKRKMR